MSMDPDEMIAVLNDFKAGHPIQFRPNHYDDYSQEHWKDCPSFKPVQFHFGWADYRRKPEEPSESAPRHWFVIIPKETGEPCAHCGWFYESLTAEDYAHARHPSGWTLRHVREVID